MLRIIAILSALAACSTAVGAAGSADEDAVRALDQAYVAAWLAGDEKALSSLFTDDAVVIPHHGDAPVSAPRQSAPSGFRTTSLRR